MPRPLPLTYPIRDFGNEDVIGYFLVAFNPDYNHEYPFIAYKNGKVFPELNFAGTPRSADEEFIFSKFLADPMLHHVRFIQIKNDVEREIEYDPFK